MLSMEGANWISTVKNYYILSIDIVSKDIELVLSSIKSFAVSSIISLSELWAWLISLTINPSGLSDIAAFSAVILGLWIPLSIEIITRISDRYQASEVIVSLFERRWENYWLPKIFITNLLLAILLRCFIPDDKIFFVEKALAWIVIILFMGSCVILFQSIRMVKIYTYKTDYILQELMDDAEKILQ